MFEDMKTFRSLGGIRVYTEGGSPHATQRKQRRDTVTQTPKNTAARTAITARKRLSPLS